MQYKDFMYETGRIIRRAIHTILFVYFFMILLVYKLIIKIIGK
jgi:hypothetical protein